VQTLDNLPVPPSHRGQVVNYALERWQTLVVVLVASLGIAATVALFDANLFGLNDIIGYIEDQHNHCCDDYVDDKDPRDLGLSFLRFFVIAAGRAVTFPGFLVLGERFI
jgi:hypothetical protein